MSEHPIFAVLADVDGALVTKDKVLTDRAIKIPGTWRSLQAPEWSCRPSRSGRRPRAPLRS